MSTQSTTLNSQARHARTSRRVGGPLALWFATVVAIFAGTTGATSRHAPRINILFIGNSLTYTNDLPGVLEAMIGAADAGRIRVESLTVANAGLEDHFNRKRTLAMIERGKWDYVVLQQGPSATEGRPSRLEYTRRFDEKITAVGGRTALYMVWPASQRDFDFDGVCESYRVAAEQVEGMLFPVGEAWRAAWRRNENLALYGPDGFHPSPAATYLAAAVMFEQVTGHSPVGLPARLRVGRKELRLDDDVAKLLQEAAVEANENFARPKSSNPNAGAD